MLSQVILQISSQKVVEYKYYKNSGQLFYDYSGNGRHAINGIGTSITVEDVVPTDRGIYYASTKNQLTLPQFTLTSPFSIMMWILIASNCGSVPYYINFFRRFVHNTTKRFNLAYQYYDCSVSIYNNAYPTSTSITSLDTTPLSGWTWELLYVTVESTIGYFGFSNKARSTFSISPSYSEAGNQYEMHMGSFQSSVPVAITKYFVWSTLMIEGLIDVNDYFGGSVSGSCYLQNCPSSCNPSLQVDGNYYCISIAGSPTSSADGTLCDCVSYGCSSQVSCLAPGDCTFPSVEYEGGILDCACNKECSYCNNQDICTECIDSNASPNISQGCICNDGYYNYTELGDQTNNCKLCHPDCATCNQADLCLTCLNPALSPASVGCSCETGFFYNQLSGICEVCKSECKTCVNENKCIECLKPFTRASGPDCLCLNGYFLNDFDECEKCKSDCSRCRNSFECIECVVSGAEINESGCGCFDGYYIDYSVLACIKCQVECATCSDQFSCNSCKAENSEITGDSRYCKCISGYYAIYNPELECRKCDYLCKTCSGPLAQNCADCVDSKMVLTNGQCKCPDGKFLTIKKNCEDCPELCLTCTSTSCLTCKKHSRLISNECECTRGYYFNASECIRSNFYGTIKQTSPTGIHVKFTEAPDNRLTKEYFEVEFSQSLNFNFSIELVKGDEYKLNLTFDLRSRSNLTIYVYIKFAVISKTNSLLLRTKMQLLLTDYSANNYESYISDSITAKVKSASYYVIGVSMLRLISGGSFSLWIILNTLQLLAYLPLNNLNYSDKVTKMLISFNTYSVVPNPIFYLNLDKNSLVKFEKSDKSGIDYADSFVNFCPMFCEILILGLCLYILFLCSKLPIQSFSNKCQSWFNSFKYSFFIRIWIQLYYDLLIYAFINLQPVSFIQGYLFSYFSFVNLPLCILMIITAGTTFIYLPMYSFMNKELIIESDKNFNLVQFFHEFKNNKGFLSTQSYTLYFTRRIIYTLNIFYFNTQPYVQYAILTFGAAVQLAFSLYFKPYKENLDMIFSVTCEIAVFVSIAFSLFFIEGLNSKFVQSCELAILTCVSTVLCSGIVLTFVNFVRFIREKFRKEIKIEIFVDKVERIEASEVVDLSVDGKSCINEFMERSLANAESERSQIFDEISKFEEGEDLNKNLDVELNKVWQTDFVVSESLANTKSKLNID